MNDALKAEFRKLNAQWFVDDAKHDGPCDMTPWNLLTGAALDAMREPTGAMTRAPERAGAVVITMEGDQPLYSGNARQAWTLMIAAALEG